MKKLLLFLLFALATVGGAKATMQIPDQIIIGKDTLLLLHFPLSEYLNDNKIKRENIPGIEFTEKRYGHTACYRGYIATWQVINNRLYLIKIRDGLQYGSQDMADLDKMFGDRCIDGKVFAYWVNGDMFADKGKAIGGCGDVFYEREISFSVQNGEIMALKEYPTLSDEEGRIALRDRVVMNQEIKQIISENFRWSNEMTENKFIYIDIRVNTDGAAEIGYLKRYRLTVITEKTPEEIESDKVFLDEIRRILAPLKWQTITHKGKNITINFPLPMYFDVKLKLILTPPDSSGGPIIYVFPSQ